MAEACQHGSLATCQTVEDRGNVKGVMDDIPLQDDEEGGAGEGSSGEEVVKTSCSPKIVYDLSSEESDAQLDRVEERRERKKKKKKIKEKKLKHCCTGCDGEVGEIDSGLPSPLSSNNALIRCGVIQTFDEVINTLEDSEQEIDNAISSYKDVGCRLAQTEGDGQLSDVDFTAPPLPYSPPRSPSSDGCELSDGVGEKLANRCQPERDEYDESAGERLNKDELGRLSLHQLHSRTQYLRKQLNETSDLLVEQVVQGDSLRADKTIVLKHIAELTQLVQGKRANDASAFRKIVVTTQSHQETVL